MARLVLVALALIACVAISQAAPSAKSTRKLPPNTAQKLSPEERKKHPRFHNNARHRAAAAVLPDTFDARVKWPKCKSISTIRNQGMCGTCWAVSSASVMSDRLCISSGQVAQDFISSVQVASCYKPGQSGMDNCDAGGDAANAYKYATIYGVVSGGEYGSKSGCQPYPVNPQADRIPLTCSKTCTNGGFGKSPAQDGHFVDSYWTTYVDNPSPQQIKDAVQQMKTDLVTSGPITAALTIYSDFQDWTPQSNGGEPYKGPSYDAQEKGGHAVRIIGWGKSARGTYYWMIANSWGTDVGDKGVFNIEMGKNVVGIEDTISAPIIKLPNTCGSICDAPLDQVIHTKPSQSSSPAYVFQGNCSAQVQIDSTGKMNIVGEVGPIGKQFVGAPVGPITKWMEDQEGNIWIMNPTGKAGSCSAAQGSTKQTCTAGSAQTGSGAQAQAGYDKYIYYNEAPKNQYIFKFPGGSSSGSGTPIRDTITSKFSAVNSLTDIDGRKMLVCGKDAAGNGQCGVMTYGDFKWQAGSPGPLKNFINKC